MAERLDEIALLADTGSSGSVKRPLVMGILNVTPDSFSDGGRYFDPAAAVERAAEMIREGADVIDVGGESTRPGAAGVDDAEQIRRTARCIAEIHRDWPHVPISIDTRSAVVAEAALDAGATIINDVSALRDDPALVRLAAERGATVVLMHMLGTPVNMQAEPRYANVGDTVRAFLADRVEWATDHGIERRRLWVDPGIGFGKTVAHNIQLLRRLRDLTEIGPVVLGVSRKSFIGQILGADDPAHRVHGTIVANHVGLDAGVRMLRVHDVNAAHHLVALWLALKSGHTDD